MTNFHRLLLSFLLTLTSYFTFGQSWTMQQPYPSFYNCYSVDFPSADTGYLGCSHSTLLKTTDGGLTWKHLYIPQYYGDFSIENLNFQTNEVGYFAAGRYVFKTTDGGENWDPQMTALYGTTRGTYFLNDSIGYAYGDDDLIYKTTNAGETWIKISHNPNADTQLYCLEFADEQNGYYIENKWPYIYTLKRTEDGGITWNNVTLPEEIIRITALDVLGPEEIWIGSLIPYQDSVAKLYHSTDKGTTWDTCIVGENEYSHTIESITFFNSLQGRAISDNHIYSTNDGGVTWEDNFNYSISTSSERKNFGNSWVNPDTCFLAGDRPSLIKTYDRGFSVEEIFQNADYDYYSVYFIDTLRGFAGGNSFSISAIRYTTDGGKSWMNAVCDSTTMSSTITDFYFLDNLNGLAAFNKGIYRSSDGGINWSLDTTNQYFGMADIEVTSNGTILIAGMNGKIFRSIDNGSTWSEIFSGFGNFMAYDFQFTNLNTGYILISNNSYFPGGALIYKTVDGGFSWEIMDYGYSGKAMFMDFADDQNGMIVLVDNSIIYTKDGGQTWNLSSTTLPYLASYAKMFNSAEGVIVADGRYVATTNDGGASFQVIYEDYLSWYYFVNATCFVNPDHGWSVGHNGMIQKFDAHTTALKSPDLNLVNASFLAPNPASQSVRIMDVSGSLTIRTLSGSACLSQNVKAGEVISISHLPAGVYIATIVNEKGIRSCKLVTAD